LVASAETRADSCAAEGSFQVSMPTVDGGTTMLSGSFVDRGPRVSQEGTLVGYLHVVMRSAAHK